MAEERRSSNNATPDRGEYGNNRVQEIVSGTRRTKNGEVRVVPMTPAVHQLFLELRQERRLDTNQVFLYKNKPIQRIGTAFKAACRRAGIMNLRAHDFRHTAGTNLRRTGVDTATAMKIVGHKSGRMHRRYNTIEPEELHKAAAKLHTLGLTR